MVDTPVAGIDELVALQASPEVTVNEATRTLEAMASMALRGNYILNSSLRSWQEGTSFTPIVDNDLFADLFEWVQNGVGVADLIRDTNTPSLDAPFSIFVDVTTLDASIATADHYHMKYRIEGRVMREFRMGTSGARPFSLVFDVRSSVAGVGCVAFRNDDATRSYVVEYTIDAVDIWETKIFNIPGNTDGTWLVDENEGMNVVWTLASGATFQGTPNQWNNANDIATSNQVNFFENVGNEWRMANPRLYLGTIPATAVGFPVGEPTEDEELRKIQRYFQRIDSEVVGQQFGGTGQSESATVATLPLEYLPKRVAPTITVSAAADFDVTKVDGTQVALTGAPTFSTVGPSRCTVDITAPAATWVTLFGDAMRLVDDGGGSAFIDVDARIT